MGLRKSPLYSLYYSSQESGKVLLENVLKLVKSVWGVSTIIEHIRLIIPIPDDTLLRHPSKWTMGDSTVDV